ncbi:hypothetical protein [Novosphingobium aquae]|uniref:Uncharacterized protein n=1 Tax=Novosphingobium aquae TaxID=3133435 RepID=A0ABU8S862_9SPHN
MKSFIAIALILAPATALACNFNTDCNIGSKCMKQAGRLEGVCVGGMSPGEPPRENRDPYKWRDTSRKESGAQCSFNTDCEVGSMCLKESGRMYGVCIKR